MTNHQQPALELRTDVARPHWRVRLFVETPAGLRRKTFIVGYKGEISLKEARQRRMDLLAKANHSGLHDSGGMTFNDLVERFNALRMASVKASTAAFYKANLDRYVLPALGEYTLDLIGRLQVEQFHAGLSKLSWSTRKGIMATLRVVLSAAVEWRLIEYNPTQRLKLGRKSARYTKAIPTAEQWRALVEALPADTSLLVRMLAITGLRISEAISLKWCKHHMNPTIPGTECGT